MHALLSRYIGTRQRSVEICSGLEKEDYVVQPVVDVSPPKWHLGHTTWFFESFILIPYQPDYKPYHPEFHFVFNSYYESLGARVIRTDRGNLSRPTVEEVYSYRKYVDDALIAFLKESKSAEIDALVELGINHEEQHQELLWYDIKYILGHNPLFPVFRSDSIDEGVDCGSEGWHTVEAGVYEVGYAGTDFHFDNERTRHRVFVERCSIALNLVSNGEYLKFMEEGGYEQFQFWHADGWDWVKVNNIRAPLYWHNIDGQWYQYQLSGLRPVRLNEAVMHISLYEAYAFAQWKGMRLPTELEWEVCAHELNWGKLWEWTSSAYLPYPGYKSEPGPVGEYNGKFMVNQHVLRGASTATAPGHSRPTYRNFFHPQLRWMFSSIRLAKNE